MFPCDLVLYYYISYFSILQVSIPRCVHPHHMSLQSLLPPYFLPIQCILQATFFAEANVLDISLQILVCKVDAFLVKYRKQFLHKGFTTKVDLF